jgi:hypothetical protein
VEIEPFEMERIQSTWQNAVEYNLSDSGVRPLRLRELLGEEATSTSFLESPVGYPQTNGTLGLRERIASMYPDASAANVLVTNGSSEANFLAMWFLAVRAARIVHMCPGYLQMWGLARTFGLRVTPLWLEEIRGWQLDASRVCEVVTRGTKAVTVSNPNNPTGSVMRGEARRALRDAVVDADCWLLSDEVFQGAERLGPRTETLWTPGERTIVTNGLSKSYGLPGLRIGWLVGPEDIIAKLWSYRDYTTIAAGALSDRLATIALGSVQQERILTRTRAILQENFGTLERWLIEMSPLLAYVAPTAGAVCFVRYGLRIGSVELAHRLIDEHSTLTVPGRHFGLDGYLRVCYGSSPTYLTEGLRRIGTLLHDLTPANPQVPRRLPLA